MKSARIPPPMEEIIEAAPAASASERKGRVLRLKCGYNPNSSSYGSIVFVMPGALLAATAAFGAVAGLVASALVGEGAGFCETEGSGEVETSPMDSGGSDGSGQVESSNS